VDELKPRLAKIAPPIPDIQTDEYPCLIVVCRITTTCQTYSSLMEVMKNVLDPTAAKAHDRPRVNLAELPENAPESTIKSARSKDYTQATRAQVRRLDATLDSKDFGQEFNQRVCILDILTIDWKESNNTKHIKQRSCFQSSKRKLFELAERPFLFIDTLNSSGQIQFFHQRKLTFQLSMNAQLNRQSRSMDSTSELRKS